MTSNAEERPLQNPCPGRDIPLRNQSALITTSAPPSPKEPGSAFKLNPERKFMALKTKDGTFDSKPANYERDTHPAGINFELKDGTALFAPYSFLSHALRYPDEITIHYSFGIVRVRGECLSPIFTMIRSQELGLISCAADKIAKPEESRIRDIFFEDAERAIG
jgi:hypothetical protein